MINVKFLQEVERAASTGLLTDVRRTTTGAEILARLLHLPCSDFYKMKNFWYLNNIHMTLNQKMI